jgi:hypothetical protein
VSNFIFSVFKNKQTEKQKTHAVRKRKKKAGAHKVLRKK